MSTTYFKNVTADTPKTADPWRLAADLEKIIVSGFGSERAKRFVRLTALTDDMTGFPRPTLKEVKRAIEAHGGTMGRIMVEHISTEPALEATSLWARGAVRTRYPNLPTVEVQLTGDSKVEVETFANHIAASVARLAARSGPWASAVVDVEATTSSTTSNVDSAKRPAKPTVEPRSGRGWRPGPVFYGVTIPVGLFGVGALLAIFQPDIRELLVGLVTSTPAPSETTKP
jgi:hypothetical protein